MANVISQFLVGVGFQYDKKGAKDIGSGIDSIKSKALQAGSVLAGAFGVKALTVDFANATDSLGKFGETFGLTANDIMGFGNALAQEGGNLESFMSQIENIERLRAGLQVGDAGFISIAGRAGIDTGALIEATTATEAYLALADQFQGMTQQQRLNAATALGLDAASIRLLSNGRREVEEIVAKFQNIRPVTDEMTEGARLFNESWKETKQNVGSVVDVIGNELMPVLTDVTDEINSWFDENRLESLKAIASLVGTTFGVGAPEDVAEATGLPEWLFTPIRELPGIATDNLSDATSDFFNSGNLRDNVNIYQRQSTQLENPSQTVVPSNTFIGGGRAPTQQNINVTLELDGQTIDRRTMRVIDGMAQTAMDDLASTTGG